jgi:sorting nexin-13
LELFRAAISKIEKQHTDSLTIERRDTELKIVLAAEDKLHPALFSSEAEHKVGESCFHPWVKLPFLIFPNLGL